MAMAPQPVPSQPTVEPDDLDGDQGQLHKLFRFLTGIRAASLTSSNRSRQGH